MNLCLETAQAANLSPIPLRFAGDEGSSFFELIEHALKKKSKKAVLAEKRNIKHRRLTSHYLWNYVLEFKDKNELAAFFFSKVYRSGV